MTLARDDRTTAVLCTIGAMTLFDSGDVASLTSVVLVGLGLGGIYRATRSRAALGLVAALVLAYVLIHFWTLLPAFLAPEHEFRGAHPNIAAAPAWIGSRLFAAVLIASVVIVRARIGKALAILAGVALLVGLVTSSLLSLFGELSLFNTGDDPEYPAHGVRFLLVAIGHGLDGVGLLFVVAAWLIVGLAPSDSPPSPARPGALVGAIGVTLLVAAATHVPHRVAPSLEIADVAVLLTVFVGWLLVAIGMAVLARGGAGRVGWIGMGLVLAQLVFCPASAYLLDAADRLDVVVLLTSAPALAGVALVAWRARELPMKALRVGIAALLVLALAGACLVPFSVFLATTELVRLRIQDPFWGTETFTVPASTFALVAWAVVLALLATPPRAAAVPAATPEPPTAGGVAP